MKTDREQIWDVLVDYCYLVDAGRLSEVPEAIFTEDASDDHGFGIVQGHEALRAMFVASADVLESTVHMLGNQRLELAGDTARSRCYVTAWHWSRSTAHLGASRPADFVSLGAYVDDLVRTQPGWRISRRICHLLGPQGLCIGSVTPELAGMMSNISKRGMKDDIGRK